MTKELLTAVLALSLLACSYAAAWQHKPVLTVLLLALAAIAVKVGRS
jgi:hypothetical protein